MVRDSIDMATDLPVSAVDVGMPTPSPGDADSTRTGRRSRSRSGWRPPSSGSHERAHIVVDGAACADCSTRECVVACPANLFVPTSDGGIVFNYEQCFECGTCYMVCNKRRRHQLELPRGRLRRGVPPHVIAVCLKWLAEPGEPGDERFGGISARRRGRTRAGPAARRAARRGRGRRQARAAAAVGTLRQALACGAARAVRIVGLAPRSTAPPSPDALAACVAGASFVWCGDMSSDRGSGSVPAFLAAALDARQALGCVGVTLGDGTTVEVVRRLDGGRREVLRATAPCVVSVEGSVARLRRAGLAATLRAADAPVEVVADGPRRSHEPARRRPPVPAAGQGPGRATRGHARPPPPARPTPAARRPTASG